jgi:hypothetical protein
MGRAVRRGARVTRGGLVGVSNSFELGDADFKIGDALVQVADMSGGLGGVVRAALVVMRARLVVVRGLIVVRGRRSVGAALVVVRARARLVVVRGLVVMRGRRSVGAALIVVRRGGAVRAALVVVRRGRAVLRGVTVRRFLREQGLAEGRFEGGRGAGVTDDQLGESSDFVSDGTELVNLALELLELGLDGLQALVHALQGGVMMMRVRALVVRAFVARLVMRRLGTVLRTTLVMRAGLVMVRQLESVLRTMGRGRRVVVRAGLVVGMRALGREGQDRGLVMRGGGEGARAMRRFVRAFVA